jgi:hypothetical protein
MIIDTLTFSNKSEGWTSRWTYRPEWMIGLNSSFYSFKEGNLWQHDINQNHTQFYGNDPFFSVSTIINESPTEVKMFKTLAIDGTTGLNVTGYTDLDQVEMLSTQFLKKEGKWYAYLRRPYNEINYELLSTQGIGVATSVVSTTINFDNTISNINAGDATSGDVVYKELNGLIELVGTVSSTSATSITVASYVSTPVAGDYIFIIKRADAESYGARGYYLNLTMSLTGDPARANHEVFAIKSSIFKSFP